jgi:hypothetical protein
MVTIKDRAGVDMTDAEKPACPLCGESGHHPHWRDCIAALKVELEFERRKASTISSMAHLPGFLDGYYDTDGKRGAK